MEEHIGQTPMRKTSSTPDPCTVTPEQNLFSVVTERAQRTPDATLLEYREADGSWTSLTATQVVELIRSVAKGFLAIGLTKGDCVSIMSKTRWEWTILDCAITGVGGIVVPIYETNSPAQITAIMNDSTVKIAFVENSDMKDKTVIAAADVPSLTATYMIDDGAITMLQEFGKSISDEQLEKAERAVVGDDLATIVYTSGSTGTPKGVEITHHEFVSVIYSGRETMPKISYCENGCYLMFLPLAHVFARYMQFYTIAGTQKLAIGGGLKTLLPDFQHAKPTLILGVPRVFEKIYNAATQKAGTGLAGRIFARSVKTARQWSELQQSGKRIPWHLSARRKMYDKLVYSQIREVLGGRAKFLVSGGAPIDRRLSAFFNGIGLPLLEGYGMTETAAPCAVNPVDNYKVGSVGTPLGGITFGVAEDGEIMIKGPSVCKGYHNKPDMTAETITPDGWIHTGDLGDIDDDGFIYITGRKKELIITAGGKNVSPGPLEASIMTSPLVDQCVVIGDRRPFIAALITLDLDGTNAWLQSQGAQPAATLEEASINPIVKAEVDRAVRIANSLVSRAESIRKFEILPDTFTEENGMLTASMKARRQNILKHYAHLINTVIYTPKPREKH